MEDRKTIEVDGATQDEALANAQSIAEQNGYQKVSLKNIIKITYSAELYDPIKVEEQSQE